MSVLRFQHSVVAQNLSVATVERFNPESSCGHYLDPVENLDFRSVGVFDPPGRIPTQEDQIRAKRDRSGRTH